MAERNLTPGGTPINAAENRSSPPLVESTTYCGSISSSKPQRPFSSRGSEDPAGRKPPIADECGRHSDLPMDLAGTTSGTAAKTTGWYLDYPVFPPAQRSLIVANSQGKQTPTAARQCWAHAAAQSRPSPVHRRRHRRPFLSKSKRARNHPTGGPDRAGRTRFLLAPPKSGVGNVRGEYIYHHVSIIMLPLQQCFNIDGHVIVA